MDILAKLLALERKVKVALFRSRSKYKVYTALLTQTGTDAPVATVLENTFDETPVWSRVNVGDYSLTFLGTLAATKTVVSSTHIKHEVSAIISKYRTSDSVVKIITRSGQIGGGIPVGADDLLINEPIEIRVYP